jgi:hypothetical protein
MAKVKASLLKGVYNLNPTKMVFKQGSDTARKAVTENVPGAVKKSRESRYIKVNKGTRK